MAEPQVVGDRGGAGVDPEVGQLGAQGDHLLFELIGGAVRDRLGRPGPRSDRLVAAASVFVSVHTVEANLKRIYRKLGIRSRTELASRFRSGPTGS